MKMKMSQSDQALIDHVIGGVCRAMQHDLGQYVRTWGCYKAGELDTVIALLDPRDRDNLLQSFGRYLAERKVEFASND